LVLGLDLAETASAGPLIDPVDPVYHALPSRPTRLSTVQLICAQQAKPESDQLAVEEIEETETALA
jgi:hypothetical protein